MGVEAVRPADAAELTDALERALAHRGPDLIEVVVPAGFSPRGGRPPSSAPPGATASK
jgi:thiamine pyrophosphate-dependent acetolactate synthase large subunit-like protein